MAYVRARGHQVLIVKGDRDATTKRVVQRTLFTIYSKAEAEEALADLAKGGGRFGGLLVASHSGVTFDWKRIRRGLQNLLHVLPEQYDVRDERVRSRFRDGLRSFARQLLQADPQQLLASAELIREHRGELEFLADVIAWRTKLCEQPGSEWNSDNRFYWRFESASRQAPADIEELAADWWERRDLDRAESAFRLMVDCLDGYAEGHNYLGLIALDRGRPEEAIESFTKTMELGRHLFPSRIAKRSWWRDDRTRPYMRGMRNLAMALNRAGRFREALDTCDRLENECGDRDTAMAHRASVYLNSGLWPEAVAAALYLHRVSPRHSLAAALALFEVGRRREALEKFIHGALNGPRAARMLLGIRDAAPRTRDEAEDHNVGVTLCHEVHGYLRDRRRASLRFFKGIATRPSVTSLLKEAEDVVQRWHEQHRSGGREAFDRMNEMRSIDFARNQSRALADELALPPDAPLILPAGRRRDTVMAVN